MIETVEIEDEIKWRDGCFMVFLPDFLSHPTLETTGSDVFLKDSESKPIPPWAQKSILNRNSV